MNFRNIMFLTRMSHFLGSAVLELTLPHCLDCQGSLWMRNSRFIKYVILQYLLEFRTFPTSRWLNVPSNSRYHKIVRVSWKTLQVLERDEISALYVRLVQRYDFLYVPRRFRVCDRPRLVQTFSKGMSYSFISIRDVTEFRGLPR